MSDYTPQVGHRVRRTHTVEGTVTSEAAGVVELDPNGGFWSIAPTESARGTVTWERLPDPDPDWQPGDIAQDAQGFLWRRRHPDRPKAAKYPWEGGSGGDWELDERLPRPLTRLVPEQQP